MKREWTNAIRSILDNYVPRRWRNASWFMRPLFFLAYRGRNIHSAMHFKTLVKTWTPDELTAYYQQLNSISRNRKTDNSQKTIEKILAIALASKGPILDAGCGTGYLLSLISDQNKTASLYGCDIAAVGHQHKAFAFEQCDLAALPYPDKFFDLVISTHTIEHILPLEKAISELKRVCRNTLVLVTPRQQYFYYTLDEHVNFFEKETDLTEKLLLANYDCSVVDGDWFYIGYLGQPTTLI